MTVLSNHVTMRTITTNTCPSGWGTLSFIRTVKSYDFVEDQVSVFCWNGH